MEKVSLGMRYLTLQKSMLFTPLLPSAGPTGGEGEAWPAPTISLTIWSFANAFLAIVGFGGILEELILAVSRCDFFRRRARGGGLLFRSGYIL